MQEIEIRRLLDRLASGDPQQAWRDFLQEYAGIVLDTVRFSERGPDHVSDCFLYCCEQLHDRRFRRLRAFRCDGSASFVTWLRAVVRNLCVDWRRQAFGRERLFQSVGRLGTAEQRAFHYLYLRRLDAEHTTSLLRADFPELSEAQVEAAIERLHASLSPRQQWLLSTRAPQVESLDAAAREGGPPLLDAIPAGAPDPEAELGRREVLGLLRRSVDSLAQDDRLLLQLRYEQDLTLAEIALLVNLKDAFAVDRRLRAVLAQLRAQFSAPADKKSVRVRAMQV